MVYSIKETINETVNQQAETPSNTKTKAVLNQAVADLSVAASIVHQVHWYMRGPGFLYLHPKMDELMAKRVEKQPLDKPSAGSTFKRPEGYFAGTLIEQTGLKGLTVGGAQVSTKHAGFVINRGGATCADVLALIRQVQQAVYAAHGVHLEPEVRIVR
mgnify:CR=1 FL=1